MFFFFICSCAFSQSSKTKKLLDSIEGQWELNESGQLEYIRIIEVPGVTADELYNRAINFLHQLYNNSTQTIRQQDREQGRIFVKGIFGDVHQANLGSNITFNADHSIQVDTKEGRVRIILTIDSFNTRASYGGNDYSVSQMYPINEKMVIGTNKTASGKAFYGAHTRAINLLDALEEAEKGAFPTAASDDDW